MYNFQADENAVPIFYVNKATWTELYKSIILQCLYYRMCYILVEPDIDVLNRMVEITCMCRADFIDNYDVIEKTLGIKQIQK